MIGPGSDKILHSLSFDHDRWEDTECISQVQTPRAKKFLTISLISVWLVLKLNMAVFATRFFVPVFEEKVSPSGSGAILYSHLENRGRLHC